MPGSFDWLEVLELGEEGGDDGIEQFDALGLGDEERVGLLVTAELRDGLGEEGLCDDVGDTDDV